MNAPRTCPDCLEGDHPRHIHRWNGQHCYCPCDGECATLPNRVERMFMSYRGFHQPI